jgi:hypothetical protein
MSERADVPEHVREALKDDPVLTVADWVAYHEDGDGQ